LLKKGCPVTVKECYEILELPRKATLEDVKAAYRRLAFALHPDLNPAPDAARRFQAVNEAYVLLRQALEKDGPQRKSEQPKAGRSDGRDASREKKADTSTRVEGKTGDTGSFFFSRFRTEPGAGNERETASETQDRQTSSSRFRMADSAYARQEEVLQDILQDPFARRVFEDIYSEIRKTGVKEKAPPTDTSEKRLSFELGGKKLAVDVRKPGVVSKVGNWLRRQIDDEQTVYVSPAGLHPGARILLKIQQGMSEEVRSVEVVLPSDFVSGKPLRLKGLGRKIGPWQGDLYLKVLPKG